MENEPVTVQAAIGSAINATLGLLGLVFKWPQELMSSLLLVSSSWVMVLAVVLARPKVTPVAKVQSILDRKRLPRITALDFKNAR